MGDGMTENDDKNQHKQKLAVKSDAKKKQLAQALRHNLRRRKAQPDADSSTKES